VETGVPGRPAGTLPAQARAGLPAWRTPFARSKWLGCACVLVGEALHRVQSALVGLRLGSRVRFLGWALSSGWLAARVPETSSG